MVARENGAAAHEHQVADDRKYRLLALFPSVRPRELLESARRLRSDSLSKVGPSVLDSYRPGRSPCGAGTRSLLLFPCYTRPLPDRSRDPTSGPGPGAGLSPPRPSAWCGSQWGDWGSPPNGPVRMGMAPCPVPARSRMVVCLCIGNPWYAPKRSVAWASV